MNNDRRSRLWIVVAAVVAVVICLLIAGLFYSFQRTRSFNTRPLVIIHNPLNRDEIELGNGVLLHATGRSQRGVVRMELWVDNELVVERDTDGQAASPLTLTKAWFPTTEGTHLILVKAITKDGVEGQSSIGIIAVGSGEVGGASHTVGEGETIASIADEYDTTPEDIEDINPDLGPGGPAPGDSLEIPDSEPGGGGEAPPPPGGVEPPPTDDDVEPPDPEAESPSDEGVVDEVADWFGAPGEGMVGLQVDFVGLATIPPTDNLHCYVGFAGGQPLWFPDSDNDQSTDEYFPLLEDLGDMSAWDIAPYLSNGSTPVIFWPENETFPFEINCIGVAGGTEALDFGHARMNIEPERWNGVTRGVGVAGDDGRMQFEYRIVEVGDRPRGVPMYLDPDMTSPANVRIDDRRISLRWDYEPEADAAPIDGFRVYLNGNLQWVELPDARESGLPYEWLVPPCGTNYTFGVTAFRYGYPDGPESFPGITMVNTPVEDCNREITINFLALETFDLGGDGRYEDRDGDIGPPYGWFIANDRDFFFDTRAPHIGPGEGGLDVARGLYNNTFYDLPDMVADSTWGYTGGPSLTVDVPQGGTFEFGFNIMDDDTGRCRDSDDRGCDDLICDGMSVMYEDNNTGILDRFQEGAIDSNNGRCRVHFSFGPAFGSQVGNGAEGEEPLPWIDVEDISLDEATGALQVHVRNTGTATWPWRDLEVQLVTRVGHNVIRTVTYPGYVLEAGQRDILEAPELYLEPPYDGCVLIDPHDQVLEFGEERDFQQHVPVCPRLPDLEIRDVSYDPTGGGRLRVTVRNSGDGSIERRRLVFHVLSPSGMLLDAGASYPHSSMEPGEERLFHVDDVSETVRQQMALGYSVVINPEGTIVESDFENNSFEVPEAQRLWIYWWNIQAPESYRRSAAFNLNIYATSGDSVRDIASWSIGDEIDWGACTPDSHCIKIFYDNEFHTHYFDIFGDENLEVSATASNPGTLHEDMSGVSVFGPGSHWGSHPVWNSSCHPNYDGLGNLHSWVLGRSSGNAWAISYNLCREEIEEE